MRRLFLILILAACCMSHMRAQDKPLQRIFLVGDAGELKDGRNAVCDWLKLHVDWNDTSNTLLFLGDNIYPAGLPAEGARGYEAARKALDYQVGVVRDHMARAYFVPGNHDWKQGRTGGFEQIKNQQRYLEGLGLPNVQLLPRNGCPGPEEILLSEKLLLVIMDSQWWLQGDDRPAVASDCECKSEDEIATAFKDIVNSNPDKLIVVAMHHPFYSNGRHGGYYGIKQHIFPLTDARPWLYVPMPVVGSLYPLIRGGFGNIQDTRHPRYREMIEKLESGMKGKGNVIHVAGHEHALQLLHKDSTWFVVSGSGAKTTNVRNRRYSAYVTQERGFTVIEVFANGNTAIKTYTLNASSLDDQPFDFRTFTATLKEDPRLAEAAGFPDSVTVTPARYFGASAFKKLLLGKNYRQEWMTPMRVRIFDMNGWKPLKRGGGKQSHSLRIKGADDKQYVLRSIEKFVLDEALPPDLRGTFVKDIVADGVSASYPLAALSIPPLAAAVNVPHAKPTLVYIPDDPRLGKFRADFANTLAIFEEREPGVDKSIATIDVEEKLEKDNDNRVDQLATLRARMLDMFVMDFDRHEDQWRWGSVDNGKGKTYFPIPRDRDQPFFVSEGLFGAIARQPSITPQLQGFRAKAININNYNFAARNFDRNFLNELSAADWDRCAAELLAAMTDEVLERAMAAQPAEISGLRASEILAKLKLRRRYFADEMKQYYRFLAKRVTITGSNKRELFSLVRLDDGAVSVTVSKITKDGDTGKLIYQRTFTPADTRELRLYGLDGDDQFVTNGNASGRIRVRLIGGPGRDGFEFGPALQPAATRVYELAGDTSSFTGDQFTKFVTRDAASLQLDRRGYKYNVLAPMPVFGYNPDDGLFLGAAAKYTKHGFRKKPFAQQHSFMFSHALATKAFLFRYGLEATDAIGKTDLLFNVSVRAPHNTVNFFGYGNESAYEKSNKIRYYRARFNLIDGALLLRANWGKSIAISVGPVVQFYAFDSSDNRGRFINQTVLNGLDKNSLYHNKFYAGGRVAAVLDNRNSKSVPSRGVLWESSYTALGGGGDYSNDLSRLNSELSLFMSFNRRANLVIATRIGGGVNFGKYEFFQSQYLSGTENLRGYRKYRFAGDKILYHNLDLRIKLAEFRSYLFPGAIGVLGFHDVGRVWLKGERSSKWHQGYGGGLWLAPLSRFVITGSWAVGDEGGLGLVSLGFLF